MANQRLHIRLECNEHCHLHLRDSFYPARTENISLGGVLVRFDGSSPGVQIGENCRLLMSGLNDCEYLCEIARVETVHVALRFMGLHITT